MSTIMSECLLASIQQSINAIEQDNDVDALQLLTNIENDMTVILEMIRLEDQCELIDLMADS